jgi:hypothetical protein
LYKTLYILQSGQPDATAPPLTITGLRQQIESFQKQCLERVGEEGLSLLTFLQQDDTDFPVHLRLNAIRKALVSLRPFIVISLRTGGQDA